MKKYLVHLFSLSAFACFSQDKSLNYDFGTYGSRLSYFTVWNSTDTSIVAGKYKIDHDTVFFEEILDTLIAGGPYHMASTHGNSSICPPNTIQLNFHYLDKATSLLSMPHFNYQFMGNSVFSSICENPLELDTVHYIPYIPGGYDSLVFEKYKFTYCFYGQYAPTKGKKRKKLDQEVMAYDFMNFTFVVYYSIKKFKFDLRQMVGEYVFINGIKYPIVIGE
jgi:hypothetical protein